MSDDSRERHTDPPDAKQLIVISTRPWAKGLRQWLLTLSIGIALIGTINIWSKVNSLRDYTGLPLTTHAEVTDLHETSDPSLFLVVFVYRYDGKNRLGTATMPAHLSKRIAVGNDVVVHMNPPRVTGRMAVADEAEIDDLLGRRAVALALASFLFAFLAARLRSRVQTSKRYASDWTPAAIRATSIIPGLWKYEVPDMDGNVRAHYKVGRLPRRAEDFTIYINPDSHAEHVTLDSVNRYVQIESGEQPRQSTIS